MINLRIKLEFILEGLPWIASTFRKPKYWITFLVVLGASIGLEFYGRACGFNLTSDSIQYLSSAKSFQSAGKFLGDDGTYNPYWPPLFPVLLSWSANPLGLLVFINLLCKVVIGLMTLYLANTFLKNDFYRSAFLLSTLLSVYMIMISVFVWTELLFTALILLNIYFVLNLHHRYYFVGLIITGFLLCIQRNAGLFWISGLTIWLMMNQETDSTKINPIKILIFFFVSTSGLWAWNIYNTFFIPTNFIFYDRLFFDGFLNNVLLMAGSFAKMVVPTQSSIVSVSFFLSLSAAIFYWLRPITKNVFAIVIAVYATGFTLLGKLDPNELDRYLSVVTPFCFLLLLMLAERIVQSSVKWVRYGVVLITIIFVSYTLVRTVKNVQLWHDRSCFSESSK